MAWVGHGREVPSNVCGHRFPPRYSVSPRGRALARDRGRRSQSVGGQQDAEAEAAAKRMAQLLLEEEATADAAAADGLRVGHDKRSASPHHHPRSAREQAALV